MTLKHTLTEYLKKFETVFKELYQTHKNLVGFTTFELLNTNLEELVDFELQLSNTHLIIKYNEDSLIERYLCNKYYNEADLYHNFEYFGCHEFGHKLLPEHSQDEFMIQCYRDFRILNYKHFLHGFREFFAEWFASQNCSIIPEKYLSIIVSEQVLGDPSVIYNPHINISKFILNNLFNANKCFAFDRWELLNDHYRNNKLQEFQDLLYSICFNYKKIIMKFNDYDTMRKNLKDFVKYLEDINILSILKNELHVDSKIYNIDYE